MRKELDIIHWNEVKIALKQKYSQLTNADLQWRDTNQEDMLSTIANNLEVTKRELREIIKLA